MKAAKKLLALVLVLAMVSGFGAAFATNYMGINLRIEGIETNLYYADVQVPYVDGTVTVLDLIDHLTGKEGFPDVTIKDSGYGAYISEINYEAEMTFGSLDGWQYRVNGEPPAVSIGNCELSEGDRVVIYYGDEFGVGMQYPEINIDRLISEGVVSFSSLDISYDSQGNAGTAKNPVAGATVHFDSSVYTTDENGEFTVADSARTLGAHSYSINRHMESALPTVLRSAPGSTATFEFDDVPTSAWYHGAVGFAVEKQLFYGTGAKTFEPGAAMTRAMFVTVLWRFAGEPAPESGTSKFLDVIDDKYYGSAVVWASENGIASGYENGLFGVNDSITRQQMAAMLYNYAEFSGMDVSGRVDLNSSYGDADLVASWAESAVSWAAYAGVMKGDGNVSFNPTAKAERCQAAEVLRLFSEL